MQSDDEMQVLRQLYLTMLRALRHQYLDNLLEMQALCSLLCCIHSSAQVSLLEMSTAHMQVKAYLDNSVAHHCQGLAQHLIATASWAARALHMPRLSAGCMHSHQPAAPSCIGWVSFDNELVCHSCCVTSEYFCLQMGRLQQLKEQHLRPVIKQLQEPKKAILNRQIHRQDVDRLIRLKDLMGPFIQDFSRTAHALRHQAFKVRILPKADSANICSTLQGTLAAIEDLFCICALQWQACKAGSQKVSSACSSMAGVQGGPGVWLTALSIPAFNAGCCRSSLHHDLRCGPPSCAGEALLRYKPACSSGSSLI